MKDWLRRTVLVAAAGATWLGAGTANAQESTFHLDRLQVGGAPDDGISVWRPYLYEKTRVYASSALGYSLNPLRKNHVTDDAQARREIGNPVNHQIQSYWSAGVEINRRFGINLLLPLGWTHGADANAMQNNFVDPPQRGMAFGDLRAGLRFVGHESDDRKFRFGGGGSLFFPTGNHDRLASDDETTAYIYASAEYDFDVFLLSGTLGPHFRPDLGLNNQQNADLNVGSELRHTTGAYIFLRDGELRLGAEILGTTGFHNGAKASKNISYEWLGQARWDLAKIQPGLWAQAGGGTQLSDGYGTPNIRVIGQIGWWSEWFDEEPGQRPVRYKLDQEAAPPEKDTDGDGFPDSIDLCPTIKEDGEKPRPEDGCPAVSDRDGDGIPDEEDRCPDDPEDKDGIEDADGCPEDDADGDGILDKEDACPIVAGVRQDDPKKNGCPKKKRKRIFESEGEIKLLEAIQFETAKATIKPVSYPILDEVVELMKSRPEIRVAVHGHTDSRGAHWYNVKLSKDRAASVMKYLSDHGIDRKRLESDGFGPDKPVDTNKTAEGRAKNRRVEFKILE